MIASIAGRVRSRGAGRIVLEAAGVGYEIFVPLTTYYRVPGVGAAAELEIRQVVREDAITLYGFATPAEKQAFDLLLGVQHVGPRLALAILSVLPPDELAGAVADGDVDRIDAAPGVGPKVAERVVRELRDKIGDLALHAAERPAADRATGHANGIADDALSALVNLGYKPVEARRALDRVASASAADGIEGLIRKALAVLLGEK
jgi:Holliday junction DNA helicase RuvA